MSKVQAVVFDMDGTLVDNMRFHADAWVKQVERMGLTPLSHVLFEQRYAGRKNDEIFPDLLGRPVPQEELHQLAHEKESLYRSLYAPHLAPLRGLLPLIDRLKAQGVALAVASAAPPENRQFVLDGLSLRQHFAVVVGAEDAPRGKPFPDLFLAAAKGLGVAPAACVAVEDAVFGVQAAVAAGMRCVGVTTATDRAALQAAGAHHVCTDFVDFPLAEYGL